LGIIAKTFIINSRSDTMMTVVPPQTTIDFDDFVRKIRINSGPNIRYVSPRGDDVHDGLSWATAKETVLGAYDSIVDPGTEGNLYGVIYIAHKSKIDKDPKQGIWIMGEGDPYWSVGGHTYATDPAPAGWRKAKHVLFKGVGGETVPYAHPVAAQLGQIGQQPNEYIYYLYDENYPAIWISGAKEIAFEDLIIRYRKVGINLGVLQGGFSHIDNDDASYCLFRNVCIDVVYLSANVSEEDRINIIEEIRKDHPELANMHYSSTEWNTHLARHIQERVGPCVNCEKGLKVAFENCVFSTTHLEQRRENDPDLKEKYGGYSDNRACIMARTPSVIQISNCVFKNGNFKYYGGIYDPTNRGPNKWDTHPFALDVRNCFFEGSFIVTGAGGVSSIGPLVHLIAASQGSAFIENVGTGDLDAKTIGGVKIEGSEKVAGDVVCINVATVVGPATILGTPLTDRWQNITSTLARQRQVGFWQGRISAQHDSARRAFSPVAARFKNLVKQDPSTWTVDSSHGGPSIQTGVIAPDGTFGAFRLSPTLSNGTTELPIPEQIVVLLYYVNDTQSTNTPKITINKGDVIAAGVWVRAVYGKFGLAPWNVHLLRAVLHPEHKYEFDNNQSELSADSPLRGDGEWEWISVVGRVKEVRSVPTALRMYLSCARHRFRDANIDYVHDFYAPILLHIPGNDVSENEIYELRQHMSTWPDNVEPGTVSLQRGQDFALQSHIVSRGMAPRPVGHNWSGGVDGNEVSGRIYVNPGSIIEDGIIASLGFIKFFRSTPRVLLTAANDYASTVPIFVRSSEKEFSIYTTMTGKLEKDSEWNYFVIE
jgi:hypothetical protein